MTRPDTGIKTLLLTFAAIAWLTAGAHPLQAQTAPFTQCPAVGGATSCQALVVMSNSGVSVLTDMIGVSAWCCRESTPKIGDSSLGYTTGRCIRELSPGRDRIGVRYSQSGVINLKCGQT